jgi:hypothetical protein
MGRFEEYKKNRPGFPCPVYSRLGAFQISFTSHILLIGVSAPPKKLKRTRSPEDPHWQTQMGFSYRMTVLMKKL